MKSTLFFFLMLAAFASTPLLSQTEDERFSTLSKDFLEGYFVANPIAATSIGVHEYDDRMDDIRPTALQAEVERLRTVKAKLDGIDKEALSPGNAVDYSLLRESIDEMLFGMTELRELEWNPMVYTGAIGNAIASLITQEFAPLEQRLKNAAARAEQVPAFLRVAKNHLTTAPKMHVEVAILQNQGNIGMFKEDLPKAAENSSAEIRKDIATQSAAAIAALEEYGTWLEKELLPKATKDERIGKELYNKKLSHALKSSLTPEQILERAEAEVKSVHDEMYTLAAPLYKEYYNEPAEGKDRLLVIRKVFDTIVLDHPKKEELIDVVRNMMPEIEKFVTDHDLLTLDPSQPLVIRETPVYQRGVSVASLEAPGPLEKNLKSFYNVTPIDEEWTPEQVESFLREYNNWSLRNLNIHEGIPGHYVQLYYANRYPSVLRAVLSSGPMIEGWAVYCERMMVEEGFMNHDPRMKLIQLKWYIRAVINAIIDQKIHTAGMTEQEAMDLMTKAGFQEEREAAGKWRRANLTSAQLTTYFAGFQEIWDLREAYKKKMGDEYSVKTFNETFLSFGSPPVKYIRDLMVGE